MEDIGWVKLYRSLRSWEWKKSPKHVAVFVDLLLEANHKDNKYMGTEVKKGQLTTSYAAISQRTGVSIQSVRTVLTHLKSTGEVTTKNKGKYSLISITNYENYQDANKVANNQLTSNQQATNKQLTTNKNDKNVKNEKNDKNIYIIESEILKSWNAQKVIVHKETKSKLAEIKRALKTKKDFSPSDIKQAIKNYGLTVNSQDTWFSYKWDLVTFLKNQNALKFYGDNFVLSNYLRSKPSNVHSLQDPAISVGCGANRKFRPENTTQNPYLEELWDEMEQGL